MCGGDTELAEARYSYGGDEYVFVELAEAMSLKVNFRAMAITNKLGEEGFLAPYAYLAISSMEVASMRLVTTRYALETTIAQGVQRGVTSHPWDALTPKQKVDALDAVIRRAVATGMAEMTVE